MRSFQVGLLMAEMSTSVHGTPPPGMECLAMMEDIDHTNYVEYQTFPSLAWKPCLFAAETVESMHSGESNQYAQYMERIQKSDCKAEMKRLLDAGPPVWVGDEHAMPLPEGDTHVVKLWFMNGDREVSAMLRGATDGAARQALWDELRAVHAAAEAAEPAEGSAPAES